MIADMENLIGERSSIGISSLGDLGDYYRQFLNITTYLIARSRLSSGEQSRSYLRGFGPVLQEKVHQRLQLILPTHYPDDPYTMEDIQTAARFVLYGTSTSATIAKIEEGAD